MLRYLFPSLLIAGILVVPAAPALGRSKADSLEAALRLESQTGRKITLLLVLSEEMANSHPDKGLVFAREALRLAETVKDPHSILLANTRLADVYWKSGALKQAAICGQLAMDLSEKMKLDEAYFSAAMISGYIYDALGDYNRSSELFFACLKTGENLSKPKMISRALYGIGYTCFSQNNFTKALEYYQHALSISRKTGDTASIAGCLNNISAVYGSLNDTQFIERYVREAVAINLKMDNLHWVSINYGNLGQYFMERGLTDSAFRYFQKAYDIAFRIRNASQMASSSFGLANYYVRTGDPEKGLKLALDALALGIRFGLMKSVYETTQLLRDIYMQKNDLKQAYHYDTLRYMMKDSLDLDANNILMSKLELRYELEKNAQVKQLKEHKRLAITIIILVALVAVIIIMVLLYVRHRLKSRYLTLEKDKLEAELDHRNKELASNVMALMKKNEILSEIMQQLINLQKKAVKEETRTAIEHIAVDLQKSMEVGIWEEFELRFRQVHKEFYSKLMQKFPELSPNEQKLCAFLRLNMSNKEISELTGQSTKALETARYRLRIKFGLSNSQVNLITFLSSI